jgi:hypothetical protein
MRREDLHHLVAAAAQIVSETEFVVVGSQAILASYPDAPEALLRSQEADIYPRCAPDKAPDIDGALGDGSRFQQTFGYYAHGVGPETAKAPLGWADRLVVIEVPPRPASDLRPVAFCLEPHDLVLSKLAANRERDWVFAKDALAAGLVKASVLLERASDLPVEPQLIELITVSLKALVDGVSSPSSHRA